MAKLTIPTLKALVVAQIDADLQAQDAPFDPSAENITGLLIKIGKQITQDSTFVDRLPELEGDELAFGTTIEEYFTDLVLPVNYDPDGATNMAPKRLTFEDVVYSYELPRKTIPVTVDDNKMEKALLGQGEFSTLVAQITKRLNDSLQVYKYFIKKQLLGNFISKVPATANPKITVIAKPTDTTTGEAWIKAVKKQVTRLGTFLTEDANLKNVLATSPTLELYVLPEILEVIDVDVLAGAFNSSKVEIPVSIKQLEDFGTLTANENTYALLIDPRGVKLHGHRFSATSDRNGQGEFTTYYNHYTPIGYISKYTNIHLFTTALD